MIAHFKKPTVAHTHSTFLLVQFFKQKSMVCWEHNYCKYKLLAGDHSKSFWIWENFFGFNCYWYGVTNFCS